MSVFVAVSAGGALGVLGLNLDQICGALLLTVVVMSYELSLGGKGGIVQTIIGGLGLKSVSPKQDYLWVQVDCCPGVEVEAIGWAPWMWLVTLGCWGHVEEVATRMSWLGWRG